MRDLPSPLARPLHILEPWPWKEAVGWLLAAVALVLVVRWWLRRRRSRPAAKPARVKVERTGDFVSGVESIRSRARESGRFRRGCHELAGLLRDAVEPRGGGNLDILTAREIERRLGEGPLTRLLVLLADMRFGRRPPSQSDFDGACDLALEARRSGGTGRR